MIPGFSSFHQYHNFLHLLHLLRLFFFFFFSFFILFIHLLPSPLPLLYTTKIPVFRFFINIITFFTYFICFTFFFSFFLFFLFNLFIHPLRSPSPPPFYTSKDPRFHLFIYNITGIINFAFSFAIFFFHLFHLLTLFRLLLLLLLPFIHQKSRAFIFSSIISTSSSISLFILFIYPPSPPPPLHYTPQASCLHLFLCPACVVREELGNITLSVSLHRRVCVF